MGMSGPQAIVMMVLVAICVLVRMTVPRIRQGIRVGVMTMAVVVVMFIAAVGMLMSISVSMFMPMTMSGEIFTMMMIVTGFLGVTMVNVMVNVMVMVMVTIVSVFELPPLDSGLTLAAAA